LYHCSIVKKNTNLKAKIVIASTLKPVIDPRAYEKIGNSLAVAGYEVHIIGSLPTTTDNKQGLSLQTLKNTSTILGRLILPWRVLQKVISIRPRALVITTHELLFIGVFYKIFFSARLIYDLQENYYLNLLYQNNYPFGIRHLLAYYVRLKEILLAVYINHFLLAEQCYVEEVKFIGQRYTIIENKYLPQSNGQKKGNQQQTELLLAGTIGTAYGVFDALNFFKQLPTAEYRLIIIGHCANKQTLHQLQEAVTEIENIDFLVSTRPVPHEEILACIGDKTIALLPYPSNKSTAKKIPTKLYEYIGMGVPVLISPNPLWRKLIETYAAGLSIDFQLPLNIDQIRQFDSLSKDSHCLDSKDIMWKYEESKLLTLFAAQFD
jgi:glycosyltransferase involved in cell wall biosynthesis